MTTGDAGLSPVSKFAGDLLGLPSGLDAPGTTLALLKTLGDHDYLPDPLAHEAILALGGRAVSPGSLLSEAANDAEERRRLAEVEEFAAGFFLLPVGWRGDRYRLLGLACARHPRLIERLGRLRPGISVDRTAITDPSSTVKRLVDDQLELFLFAPERRALEGRERAERFRSDPDLTDLERARALKALTRRHPQVVALVPEQASRLAPSKRPRASARLRAAVSRKFASQGKPGWNVYWLLAIVLMGSVSKFLTPQKATTSTPTASFRPTPAIPSIPKALRDEMTNLFGAPAIRRDIRTRLERELIRIGKPLDAASLDRMVAALPVSMEPNAYGPVAIARPGPFRTRFLIALKGTLKARNLGLDDPEIDALSLRCFPEDSSPQRSPQKGTGTGPRSVKPGSSLGTGPEPVPF